MKKSTVLIGAGALIVGSWIGASWYTGTLLEKNKEQYIQLANEQLPIILAAIRKSETYPLPELQLDLLDFKRGILSSDARYFLYEKGEKQNGIYLNSNIEHGPFPLSELMSFNLAPNVGVIALTLEKNEQTAPLFAFTQQQNPFVLKVIPANGSTRSELEISPLDINGLKSDEIKLSALINEKEKWITINSKIGSISITTPQMTLNTTGFVFDSKLQPGESYYYTGYQNISLDKFSMQSHNAEIPFKQFSLDNIRFSNQADEREQLVYVQQTLNAEKIRLDSSDFGAVKLDISFNKMDGQALKQFNSLVKTDAELAIKSFLRTSPEVIINDFSWKNGGGTGHYSAQLQFKPTTTRFQQLPDEQLFAEIIKQANSQLSLPLPMVKDFIANTLSFSEKISIKDAEERVNAVLPLIPMYLKKVDKNELVVMNGDGIQSDVSYNDNQITINGKTKSFKAFWDAFKTAE